MSELKPEQLLLLAGFVLPGATSMYVYGVKTAQRDFCRIGIYESVKA